MNGLPAVGEHTRALELTARVREEVNEWSKSFSVIDRRRIPAVSLVAAATTGSMCTVESLATLAETMLVIFALDDLIDSCERPDGELTARLARLKAIAAGQPAPEHLPGSLESAVAELEHRVRKSFAHSSLKQLWVHSWVHLIDQMLIEAAWKYQKPLAELSPEELPSYEDYMEYATTTIGGPMYVASLLVVLNDPSTVHHLPRLSQMGTEMSIAIRLANDLRSADKERVERKVNSLVILQTQAARGGMDDVAAQQFATRVATGRMQAALTQCASLQLVDSTSTGHPEAAIVATGKFSCGFYDAHDFHTFSSV
jgi:Terpene synthase family 2, C-terminal metal binding